MTGPWGLRAIGEELDIESDVNDVSNFLEVLRMVAL
jgi:hypothetical protein